MTRKSGKKHTRKTVNYKKMIVSRKSSFIVKEDNIKQVNGVAGFEKLWVWQKASKLMVEIHNLCKNLPEHEKYSIRGQIDRSSGSVCDNIAEGYVAYYYKDKIKCFLIARKEAGETQNHVRKMSLKNYISNESAHDLITRYEEVIWGINGFVNYIRTKRTDKK